MSDQPLPNDEAARSPTGEILDQTKTTEEKKEDTTSSTTDQQKPEQKTEGSDEKKTDTSVLNEKKDDEKKAEGAPEKYEDFKLPEGVELNTEELGEATTIFKELGISQEGAQKLVDLYVKTAQKAEDGPVDLWLEQQTKWKDELKNDPKIGPRMEAIRTNFSKMLDGLGDAELAKNFREAMDFTGAGNHPAFVRLFDKVSQLLTEGTHVSGAKPSPHGQRGPNQVAGPGPSAMYPNLPSAS